MTWNTQLFTKSTKDIHKQQLVLFHLLYIMIVVLGCQMNDFTLTEQKYDDQLYGNEW